MLKLRTRIKLLGASYHGRNHNANMTFSFHRSAIHALKHLQVAPVVEEMTAQTESILAVFSRTLEQLVVR
jgi:hypothetical protein